MMMERLARSYKINLVYPVTNNGRDGINIYDAERQLWYISPDDLPDLGIILIYLEGKLIFKLISIEDYWNVYFKRDLLFSFSYSGSYDFLDEFIDNLYAYIYEGQSKGC